MGHDRRSETEDRVVVLTMGRVGSKSIAQSLESALGKRVYHVHSMDPVTLGMQVAKAGTLDTAADSVRDGVRLVREMTTSFRRTRFVSMVREPIDRNVSAAFTSLRKRADPDALLTVVSNRDQLSEYWTRFYDRRPFEWFDREVKPIIGLDVFETDFPASGSASWSAPTFDLLVLKSEMSSQQQEKALRTFLDRPSIPLMSVDVQNRSLEAYELFRKNLTLGTEYVRECWASKYRRHFYPEVELGDYLDKWAH